MGLITSSAGFNPSGLAGFIASPKRIEPETSVARQEPKAKGDREAARTPHVSVKLFVIHTGSCSSSCCPDSCSSGHRGGTWVNSSCAKGLNLDP